MKEARSSICSPDAALQEDVEDIQREVEVLNLISDHENIAELIDSYEDPQHVHLVCLPSPLPSLNGTAVWVLMWMQPSSHIRLADMLLLLPRSKQAHTYSLQGKCCVRMSESSVCACNCSVSCAIASTKTT